MSTLSRATTLHFSFLTPFSWEQVYWKEFSPMWVNFGPKSKQILDGFYHLGQQIGNHGSCSPYEIAKNMKVTSVP